MSTSALIKRAQDAGLELRLVDGKVKIIGKRSAVEALIEPLRQHKDELVRWFTSAPNDPEPPLDRAHWLELDSEYQRHHFACPTCIAAGQGRGLRCGVGASLWTAYTVTGLDQFSQPGTSPFF